MSQYASAMNMKSGCAHFTRAISGGQNSSSGRLAAPTCGRTPRWSSASPCRSAAPSHCAADVDQHLRDRLAQLGRERVELHHVRSTAGSTGRARGRRSRRGSWMKRVLPGDARPHPRVVGRDVVRDVVEDQPQPARGELARARARAPPGRRSARRRRSRARSTASRSRPRSLRQLAGSVSSPRSLAPAGLRCHTPISHTASTCREPVPGDLVEPCARRSHTAVLIS